MATADIAEALKQGMNALMVLEGLVMRYRPGDLPLWKKTRRVLARLGRPVRRKGKS